MVYTDTIAAIATALSSSGIGIIRISGSDAVAVAERMFEPAVAGKRLSEQKTYTIHYGYIRDGEERIPKGKTELMAGDRLTVMTDEQDAGYIHDKLENLCYTSF